MRTRLRPATPLRRLLVGPLAWVLSGCALIHHDSAPRAPIAAENIRLADDIHLARDGWPSARWWTVYGDAQLDALIDRALADAPTMAIARTRVAQARSDVELVKAGTDLQVVALGLLDRQHVSANGFLGPYALDDPAQGVSGPWYTSGIVGLGASLNVDLWGKQRAQVAAALGVRNARLAETAAVELELSADVAQIYYGIQTRYALLDLLGQSQQIAAFAIDAHDARAARGLEPHTAVETARGRQLAVAQQIVHTRGQVTQLRESLRALIGAGADDLPHIEPTSLPASRAALPSTLSYELLARRPDLQALRWYVQASFDRIDAAKAAFYPSFDIKAFFGVNALHLGELFTHASQQINVIPGLYLPVFDGGRLNANLGGARTASNMLIEQYNQAVLDAVRDVAITGSRLQDLDADAQLQAEKIGAVSFARDSAEAHYRRGLASQLAALEAREPVIAEQVTLLEIDGQRISQEIALAKALGGGYRADSPVALTPR
ncbi:MdtP family multidrug efflux transporter outer membrane subunit [Paraburkholderia caballeronis]|uniref:MdtP family multidrug efflux transporter outer membrane subunit n=1 Tax=Paraburkholderia caballeronis TaxID=416943 RepID=UPI001066BE79|nr:MdtP family multidrug efflux transporter outer membrane subunit [Paraburkholderia caballeronis]TDV06782.1 multidrug efflux system outer membrane protein [Paraburkholderia caballeronis]TDV09962.1 multidrug efflux system outer membrane protein [Paraburkholderia caballeronis]TDV21794.1 multidrug efflux system outer membrane protein [Paraburkholderia caballeronis]